MYRVSNPNVLATISVLGSLQVFDQTSMDELRKKSLLLTGYLESLLLKLLKDLNETVPSFKLITPSNPEERGCQMSILFSQGKMEKVWKHLESKGVVVDERKPDVIRVAPVPLYNSFEDVFKFVQYVREGLAL